MPSAAHTDPTAGPVLVEVLRGDLVESRHRGAVAVVDAAGKVVMSWGDIERPVFARSAIKPLQALPLVESGAADRYGARARELALACASHHGEVSHTEAVAAWLGRAGLAADDLECGAHLPNDTPSAHALLRAGNKPSALHNNCSGKHTGFLTTARHLGEATRGYIAADHPVQRRVTQALQEMCGVDLARAPHGTDGCGIPVLGIPLAAMARGMARMADPKGLPAERTEAARRLLDAMREFPVMVDGTGGFPTVLMQVAGTKLRLKPGAEGVFCGALPGLGYGVALKIEDGAGRAAEVAMGGVLERLGLFSDDERAKLDLLLRPVIKNIAGRAVGAMRPSAALLS
ncbi:MAG: asparaginase [Alphaproteobacteria bacterium]|nr:asparaginase [Alphaproteobacteria bacterium]